MKQWEAEFLKKAEGKNIFFRTKSREKINDGKKKASSLLGLIIDDVAGADVTSALE